MKTKGPKPKDPKLRFLPLVEKTDSCWIWKGARNWRRGGYGVFNLDRRATFAHRASYLLFVGEIPAGKYVCHSCDNPCCVNPVHLWLGDGKENAADMVAKGRYGTRALPRGVDHHSTTITEADARYIKFSTESSTNLANRFGVDSSTIRNIRRGVTWRHIPPQP